MTISSNRPKPANFPPEFSSPEEDHAECQHEKGICSTLFQYLHSFNKKLMDVVPASVKVSEVIQELDNWASKASNPDLDFWEEIGKEAFDILRDRIPEAEDVQVAALMDFSVSEKDFWSSKSGSHTDSAESNGSHRSLERRLWGEEMPRQEIDYWADDDSEFNQTRDRCRHADRPLRHYLGEDLSGETHYYPPQPKGPRQPATDHVPPPRNSRGPPANYLPPSSLKQHFDLRLDNPFAPRKNHAMPAHHPHGPRYLQDHREANIRAPQVQVE